MPNTFLAAVAKAEAYTTADTMQLDAQRRLREADTGVARRYLTSEARLIELLGIYTEGLEEEGFDYKDIVTALEKVAYGLRKAYEGQQ